LPSSGEPPFQLLSKTAGVNMPGVDMLGVVLIVEAVGVMSVCFVRLFLASSGPPPLHQPHEADAMPASTRGEPPTERGERGE
jgi:hypothetical protein